MNDALEFSTPRLYVACSLTSVEGEDWRILESDCDAIKRGAVAAAVEDTDPWECYVHAPIDHTAPSRAPDLPPREVWRRNSHEVVCRADGLVAHGFDGGSCGVGQELTWAFERGLPILYVHYEGTKVSRQVRGMKELSPWFEIEEFGDVDQLERIAREWVTARRPVIESGPTHRQHLQDSWGPLRAAFQDTWEGFSPEEKARTCAVARMDPDEIEHVLEHALFLSVFPASKLVVLMAAFGLEPLLHLPTPLMGLTKEERSALDRCATRLGWGASFTQSVEFAGRRVKNELSRVVSRDELNLERPEGWDELATRWQRGDLA